MRRDTTAAAILDRREFRLRRADPRPPL